MKKNLILLFALVLGGVLVTGCSEDKLQDNSIIIDKTRTPNELDKWLSVNYVEPYNIDFKYRYEDVLSDIDYNLTPASYVNSVRMAKLTLHLCLGAYDEVTGSKAFIRTNFPKIINLLGSSAIRDTGVEVLGTAEGGKMMVLYKINYLEKWLNPIDMVKLNHYFFKTMHHEFGHILHQTIPFTTDFNQITNALYVGDNWSEIGDHEAHKQGFISPYSSYGPEEDFVELISFYVTYTQAQWDAMLNDGAATKEDPRDGKALMLEKFDIVYNYMSNNWNIDLNQLRDVVLRRQQEIKTLDLSKL